MTLEQSLTSEGLQRESVYVADRPGFERPYGLAWVLALASELQDTPWQGAIKPLEEVAVEHLVSWLPKLTHPIRSGTHDQTAFAMVLALAYAEHVGNDVFAALLRERACFFYGGDYNYALNLEPSGEDFLSPSLSAGWLMGRVLDRAAFGEWFEQVMAPLGGNFAFEPVEPSDRADGRLAHLDGLNLSRAWMLVEIAQNLDSERRASLLSMAAVHRAAGLKGIHRENYAGSHWLGTFATIGQEG